jgi:hypothetical protein
MRQKTPRAAVYTTGSVSNFMAAESVDNKVNRVRPVGEGLNARQRYI